MSSPPKRPPSAFILFGHTVRDEAQKQLAGRMRVAGDLSKEIGSRWASLSDAAKRPFYDEAERRHQQFLKEKAAWEAQYGPAPKRASPRGTKLVRGPKKPKSAYMMYLQHNSNTVAEEIKASGEIPDMGKTSKILGPRWSALPASERAHFEALAAEDKKRYDAELSKYLKETPNAASSQKKGPKRPLSAYFLFSNDHRDAITKQHFRPGEKIDVQVVSKKLGQKWKELEPKDRERYEQSAKAAKDRFDKEQAEVKNNEFRALGVAAMLVIPAVALGIAHILRRKNPRPSSTESNLPMYER